MKAIQITLVALFGFLLTSCGNPNLKDVSAEAEFIEMTNNIFFTNRPLHYYKYNDGGGVTTDHFLSLHPNDSNGAKVKEIPKGSHIKVSKVYELTLEDGSIITWITGEVFPSPNVPLNYETALIEGESIFEQRK